MASIPEPTSDELLGSHRRQSLGYWCQQQPSIVSQTMPSSSISWLL